MLGDPDHNPTLLAGASYKGNLSVRGHSEVPPSDLVPPPGRSWGLHLPGGLFLSLLLK